MENSFITPVLILMSLISLLCWGILIYSSKKKDVYIKRIKGRSLTKKQLKNDLFCQYIEAMDIISDKKNNSKIDIQKAQQTIDKYLSREKNN